MTLLDLTHGKTKMKKYKWNEWDINYFKSLSVLNQDSTKELIHNRMGRLYWVWRGDALYVQRFGRENGPYQGRNLKFLRQVKPNARTIIDVGMNVANNTMEYATWAQQVYGFEPFPETYQLAIENINLNSHVELKGRYWDSKKAQTIHDPNYSDGWFKFKNGTFASLEITGKITTYNLGLGEIAGHFDMEHHPNNAGHNCILTEDRRTKTNYKLHQIQVSTLDSYGFEDVDCIKVDVEGFEFAVLKGSVQTISKSRPVVQLEIVETQCKKFGYHPDDVFDFFVNQIGNYGVYDFKGRRLPNSWQKVKGVMDRFFVPLELSNTFTADMSDKKHPGMGERGFGRKKQPEKFFDLFKEID